MTEVITTQPTTNEKRDRIPASSNQSGSLNNITIGEAISEKEMDMLRDSEKKSRSPADGVRNCGSATKQRCLDAVNCCVACGACCFICCTNMLSRSAIVFCPCIIAAATS